MPDAPTDLARNDQLTGATLVSFTWTAPTDDGGSPVIDYTVEMKEGDADYTVVGQNVTETSFSYSTVTIGFTYTFKVSASNIIGSGDYSSSFDIIAATEPEAPTDLVENYSQTDKTKVTFTWTAPAAQGAVTVIDNSVEMK